MTKLEEKYIFIFASNYHGYYIEDLLRRSSISCNLRKAPRAVGKSCNTAIYIGEKDLDRSIALIFQAKIKPYDLYEIIWKDNFASYKKISSN